MYIYIYRRRGIYSPLPVYTEYLPVLWEHHMLRRPFPDWGRSEPSSAVDSTIPLGDALHMPVTIITTISINNIDQHTSVVLHNIGQGQNNPFSTKTDTITVLLLATRYWKGEHICVSMHTCVHECKIMCMHMLSLSDTHFLLVLNCYSMSGKRQLATIRACCGLRNTLLSLHHSPPKTRVQLPTWWGNWKRSHTQSSHTVLVRCMWVHILGDPRRVP